jgi:hypothetical protein
MHRKVAQMLVDSQPAPMPVLVSLLSDWRKVCSHFPGCDWGSPWPRSAGTGNREGVPCPPCEQGEAGGLPPVTAGLEVTPPQADETRNDRRGTRKGIFILETRANWLGRQNSIINFWGNPSLSSIRCAVL